MKFTAAILAISTLNAIPAHAAVTDKLQRSFTTPEAAANDPDFAVQGEYVGEGTNGEGVTQKIGIQIVAQGVGKFMATAFEGGLPGAGWNGAKKWVYQGTRRPLNRVVFTNDSPIMLFWNKGSLIAAKGDVLTGKFKRLERKSPTLGAKPPKGATVLFDGKDRGTLDQLKITGDGLMQQGAITKDTFGDFKLHVEFRTPYQPGNREQARGNSGVYLQRRYEVQILDSFGLELKNNHCGCLYRQQLPMVNMCLPPLTWQTYDIEFTAARFDKEGKRTANARITVKHNGVLIHDNYKITNKTGAGKKEGPEPGPIWFQDHKDPVRFRNIWILKK